MRSLAACVVIVAVTISMAVHAEAEQYFYGEPSRLPAQSPVPHYGSHYGPHDGYGGPAYHYHQQVAGQTQVANPPSVNPPPAVPEAYPAEQVAPLTGEVTTNQAFGTGVAGYGVAGVCAGGMDDTLYSRGPVIHGWFVGASGLVMGYDADDHTRLSYDNTLGGQYSVLDTKDASMDFAGGFEVRVGKYFNCGSCAVELLYWGIYPSSHSLTTTGGTPDNLRSYLDYQWVSNPTGSQTGDYYTVDSSAHRLQRDWQFHNAELNLMSFGFCCGGCDPCCHGCDDFGPYTPWWKRLCHFKPHGFMTTVGVGLRYFRFDDYLGFSASESGLGSPYIYDDARQLDHKIDIENNLFGMQLNGAIDYQLGCRLKVRAASKFGVYGNHVTQHQLISNSNGYYTYGGSDYNHWSKKDDIAFIGELDLGVNYQISCCWNVSVGYRAVVAAGVALAPGQIPQDVRDISDVRYIETNNSLLLHGGYAGFEFNF